MQITLQVAHSEADELARRLQARGLSLKPMHPGVDDPQLASYFLLEVPEEDTAEEVMRELLQLPAVEAAYIKPPDALP